MEKKNPIWMLNGQPIPADPNVILPMVLETIPDLQYWSAEGLRNLYLGVLEMGLGMAKEEKKCKKGQQGAQLTRFINGAHNKRRFLPYEQDKLLKMFYSTILSAEGFSPLNGFGVSNKWGDSIQGNPEIQSIRRRT